MSTSNDPLVEERGWFTIRLTGDIEDEFSGEAIYAYFRHPESGAHGAVLNFFTTKLRVTLTGNISRFTSRSTYNIEKYDEDLVFSDVLSEGAFFGFIVNDDPLYSDNFFSQAGIIEIGTITNDRMEGSINFMAEGFTLSEPLDTVRVTITGDFEAIKGSLEF